MLQWMGEDQNRIDTGKEAKKAVATMLSVLVEHHITTVASTMMSVIPILSRKLHGVFVHPFGLTTRTLRGSF